MDVNPGYFGVKRIGDVKSFRMSTHPRPSQLLFFAFKDFDIDVIAARTALEKHFQDSSLIAYCVASQGFERPVVIEALFTNQNEQRKVLKSQNDGVVYTKKDGSPIYATVYTPLPRKPIYRVYTIHRWMLCSIKDMKKDVKEAVICRLESITEAVERTKKDKKSKKKLEASTADTVLELDELSIWETEVTKNQLIPRTSLKNALKIF